MSDRSRHPPHKAGQGRTGLGAEQRGPVQRVFVVALGVNLLLTLLKLVVGLASGSLAVLADAMHSATDSFSSLMGLITNSLSDPRPDRDHPYGHQKYEGIGALAIAGFIFFAALEILRNAMDRLLSGLDPLSLEWHQLILLLLVLGFNILMAVYERSAGRRLGSRLLLADAEHALSDVWSTVVILAGLSGTLLLDLDWLDLVLAVPVALLLIRVCWKVLSDNLPWLVDHIAIPPESIHEVACRVPGVLNCHDIASRGLLGRAVFIDMHMIVDADDLPTAHRITEQVEAQLEQRFGPVRCTIHLEPREYASDRITFEGVHG